MKKIRFVCPGLFLIVACGDPQAQLPDGPGFGIGGGVPEYPDHFLRLPFSDAAVFHRRQIP